MLFLDFPKMYCLSLFGVPVVNNNDYGWFVTTAVLLTKSIAFSSSCRGTPDSFSIKDDLLD